MQTSCEIVFHQRDRVVASEVFMAVIVHLMRFLVHAFGLACPTEIQSKVIAELGMELSMNAELDDIGKVIGTLHRKVGKHGPVRGLVASHPFVGLEQSDAVGGKERGRFLKGRTRSFFGLNHGTTVRMIPQADQPAEHVDAAVGQAQGRIRRMGELITYQQVTVILDHEGGAGVDGEVHVGDRADKFIAVLRPERQAAHEVVVERPMLSLIEMSVDESTCRDAVAERTPCRPFMTVLVAVHIFDAVDMVFLQAKKGAI